MKIKEKQFVGLKGTVRWSVRNETLVLNQQVFGLKPKNR